jgi:RNA polymerase sigma-70 factor (ECF subfamily)
MSITDEKLLQRARRGDETAFVLLYERHRAPVFRFAYRLLGSAALAEEIAHDCFLALVKHPERFDPSRAASLRTYLLAAARNLAFKHFRQHEGQLAFDDLQGAQPADRAEIPLRRLLDAELSGEVRKAVAALPPLQREAVVLFEYEELSLAEIAAVVGADIGAVKSRLHRAREGLRRTLAPYFKSQHEIVSVEKAYK